KLGPSPFDRASHLGSDVIFAGGIGFLAGDFLRLLVVLNRAGGRRVRCHSRWLRLKPTHGPGAGERPVNAMRWAFEGLRNPSRLFFRRHGFFGGLRTVVGARCHSSRRQTLALPALAGWLPGFWFGARPVECRRFHRSRFAAPFAWRFYINW